MSQVKPTRPKRAPRSKPKTQPKQTLEGTDIAKPTSFEPNQFKYAQETMIGEPTIHPPGGIVTTVGLGGLKTETNYGSKSNV